MERLSASPLVVVEGPRRFEFSEGTSDKFWVIAVVAKNESTRVGDFYRVLVHYGRIGSSGQFAYNDCASTATARAMMRDRVEEKLRKGYVERDAYDRDRVAEDLGNRLLAFNGDRLFPPGVPMRSGDRVDTFVGWISEEFEKKNGLGVDITNERQRREFELAQRTAQFFPSYDAAEDERLRRQREQIKPAPEPVSRFAVLDLDDDEEA